MIKKTDLVFLNGNLLFSDLNFIGMMEENIKEIGKMENNTEKENFSTQKMEYGRKEYGVKVEELNGKILLLPLNKNNFYKLLIF